MWFLLFSKNANKFLILNIEKTNEHFKSDNVPEESGAKKHKKRTKVVE